MKPTDANDTVTDVAALQARVGKLSGPRDLKVIDFLDEHAQRWIATSPFLFAAFGNGVGVCITAAGGAAGFVQVPNPRRLRLPVTLLDEPHLAQAGGGFGSLFLTPSLCETLRVNGRVLSVDADVIEVEVQECYLHCAKALIRSDFWEPELPTKVPPSAPDFLALSRFVALATIDDQGRADLSPKGDPAGALIRLRNGAAWYADRPGNRRVDSFRNILSLPQVAAAALIPGVTRFVLLSGSARISTDPSVRASFAVGGKIPALVTCISMPGIATRDSAALSRASLWPAAPAADDLNPAAIFKAHIKQSRVGGLFARIARAAVAVPGLLNKHLRRDYKKNLY
jgi:predicted pyridoxine 5'-phosphate oxidase superfamily flavin-nucleotide-binding protein